MARRQKRRVFAREQGGERRFYGDFRDYADVGGKREALIPEGARTATTDERLALMLAAQRVAELEDRRRRKSQGQPEEDALLARFAVYHLREKRRSGNITEQWLETAEMHLHAAIEYFCNAGRELPRNAQGRIALSSVKDRPLVSISTRDVQQYRLWLAARDNRRGGKLSQSSQRKYLNSLSNLFARALGEGLVRLNPVGAMMDKPQEGAGRGESRWLEVPEAALLLESARLYTPKRPDMALPPRLVHALIATMLLTGGRPAEVLGLSVDDVSFERKLVLFRPNRFRGRLKNAGAVRPVPVWPQLEEILTAYLAAEQAPHETRLLFPSQRTGGVITDIRSALDEIAVRAGWNEGDIRAYGFRHTYCAARLQTLDGDHPVSTFTVAAELGHGGTKMVQNVYGHLGRVRHRSKSVEYRIEQFEERLADRLTALHSKPSCGEEKKTGEA